MKIEDGKGSGKLAEVDDKQRLKTLATTVSEIHANSDQEEKVFYFSTGAFINITTTGAETGIFYIKNTSTTDNLILSQIRTCGDVAQKVTFYQNPTGGTLITDETDAQSTNLNFTSNKAAEATVYRGANGKTITGGTWLGQHINHVGHSNVDTKEAMILGKDDSLGIAFELASAGDVCVAIEGYFEEIK